MKKNVFHIWNIFFCCLLAAGFLGGKGLQAKAAEPVVVVLDPGHGGKNLGAEYGEYTEKEMTMAVAKAMKEELEKYEGIEVYLTHDKDKDMSLEERAEFAKDLNADFLFCLHFNMSEEHDKFGAEVWVSAFGDKYRKGYTFASVEMELLEQKGLYSRGIKTRLNDKGEDYYGILRHATAMDVPAALIEHCHLDQENDQDFYGSGDKLKQFGILDATAAAKYFGLRSKTLGVDYSSYKNVEIPEPPMPVKPDTSEPDICILEVEEVDGQTGEVAMKVSAADYDSYILYYSYSYDGGGTFSDLQKWEPRSADNLTFVMKVPSGILPEAAVNVYNGYDLVTESNHISLPSMHYEEVVEAGSRSAESIVGGQRAGTGTGAVGAGGAGMAAGKGDLADGARTGSEAGESARIADGLTETGGMANQGMANDGIDIGGRGQDTPRITVLYFLQVCLTGVAILFALLLIARLMMGGRRRKRVLSKKKSRRGK